MRNAESISNSRIREFHVQENNQWGFVNMFICINWHWTHFSYVFELLHSCLLGFMFYEQIIRYFPMLKCSYPQQILLLWVYHYLFLYGKKFYNLEGHVSMYIVYTSVIWKSNSESDLSIIYDFNSLCIQHDFVQFKGKLLSLFVIWPV